MSAGREFLELRVLPVDTFDMLGFALKELSDRPACKALLADYHQRQLAARRESPEHEGWVPRIQSLAEAGDDVVARSNVVARSPDRATDATEGLPVHTGDMRSERVRGRETRAQQPTRAGQSESLSQIHGRLIALGLLTFQLADRTSGVSYQVTPLGLRALSAGPDDQANADALPQAA